MICRIKVNERCIKAGERESCTRCPVALAIEEHTNVIPFIDLHGVYLYENLKNENYLILPDTVSGKINLFDLTGEMHPFTFDLDIPERFLKTKEVLSYAINDASGQTKP